MTYRSSIGAVAVLAALFTTHFTTHSSAQVVDFGKYPNFKGQWVRVGPPNNWLQVAGPPPLTPEYQKVFADITADFREGGAGNWPSVFCIPQGMPGMMNLYDPMELVVTPDVSYILISHVNDSYRRIYTDGRDWPADVERTYAGYSIGRWIDEDGDGHYDVLEVETRFLKNPRGYDTSGLPFHKDDQTIIKERFHLDKGDPNAIYDEIIVLDHAMTRPYSIVKKATRNPNPRPLWHSEVCEDTNTWIRIGNDPYYLSADGKLMPSKRGQGPPDLTYFSKQNRNR
jgi:hypothetical protein